MKLIFSNSLKTQQVSTELGQYKASFMVKTVSFDNINWALPNLATRVDGPEMVVNEVTLGVMLMK